MKLRTSFFNPTVLRKDITRFAPVWGLYTVFSLMAFFLTWEAEASAARFANSACYIMSAMGIINFIYATICALLLFGDLFNTRLCNALHTFPMRREGWFLTHCVSGFLFCLVPNTFAALLASALLQKYCYLAFLWLALTVLQYLFFFGVGVFSVMCAGNRLGASAVCGIINFLAVILSWLFATFYDPFLYGIDVEIEQYFSYSPIVTFTDFEYIQTSYDKMTGLTTFHGFLKGEFLYLFLAAGVGIALLIFALLIYRKRNLENAGNFISLKPISPIFLIVYTLCAGAVTYYVSEIFSGIGRYIFILIGFAIGFFTGRMLLEKKVNIFRWKVFLAFGVLLAVFGITVGLTTLDPAGITRYVPEKEDIKQVQISPNASPYNYERFPCILTESADLETITEIHKELVDNRREGKDADILITYTLKNGRTVTRHYRLDSQDPAIQNLKPYYSSPEYVIGTDDISALLESAYMLEFNGSTDIPYLCICDREMSKAINQIYVDKDKYENSLVYTTNELVPEGTTPKGLNVELVQGLMDAIIADCKQGNMAQQWEYHTDHNTVGYITIQSYAPSSTDMFTQEIIWTETNEIGTYVPVTYLEFRIYEDCTNTIEYLKSIAN